ncbi:MAG: hypothetical protein ACKOTZ_04575 [Chloroflexota bacterium]
MRPLLPFRHRSAAVRALAGSGALAALLAGAAIAQDVAPPTGRIAYVAGGSRIGVIRADGGDDRTILALAAPDAGGIGAVAWASDGVTLGFVGAQEALCSVWQADLYRIAADGGGPARRITNGPACGELTGLPTATFLVTVQNRRDAPVEVILHAQGLAEPRAARIDAGWQLTVELPGVADLGPGVRQLVAASDGNRTWGMGSVGADVLPGERIDAGTIVLDETGVVGLGAQALTWGPDGRELGFQLGLDTLRRIAVDAGPVAQGTPLIDPAGGTPPAATTPAWSPDGDRILYQRFDGPTASIDLLRTGTPGPGGMVLPVTLAWGIDWFPDGSGFIVSDAGPLLDSANLLRVDLETGAVETLTGETDAWAISPAISPDGRWVAYARTTDPFTPDAPTEIRARHLATGVERRVVADGAFPDWAP